MDHEHSVIVMLERVLREVAEVRGRVFNATRIAWRLHPLHSTLLQNIFRDVFNLIHEDFRSFDHDQRKARNKVPVNMTMEEPSTGVVRDEADSH